MDVDIEELFKFDTLNGMKKTILEKYKNILLNMDNVYIFGAKVLGRKILTNFRNIDIEPVAFIDNNKAIQGTCIDGKKIISLEQVDKNCNPVIVVASTLYTNEILNQLVSNGYTKNLTPPILTLWNSDNFPQEFLLTDFQEDLIENKHEYIKLLSYLEDEKSKYILSNIIKLRKTLDFKYMESCFDNEQIQYFDTNIIQIREDEVFIDGGAFNGDTSMEFIKNSHNRYKMIYLFEPDDKLLDEAKNNLKLYANVNYNNYGIYSKSGFCYFKSTGATDGAIDKKGDMKIKTISLDEFIKEPPSFIKLDIEGGEIDAIFGSKNYIKKYKPKMAIAVYHNSYDIWKIPKLIKSINCKYKFYLRHYSKNVVDTVLYCV